MCSRGSSQSRNQILSLLFFSCTFCHEVQPKLPAKIFKGAACPSLSSLTSVCSARTASLSAPQILRLIPSSGRCSCAFTSLGPDLCTDAPVKAPLPSAPPSNSLPQDLVLVPDLACWPRCARAYHWHPSLEWRTHLGSA